MIASEAPASSAIGVAADGFMANKISAFEIRFKINASQPISRVLSMQPSILAARRRAAPATCPEIGRASRSPRVGVASDRVYRGAMLPWLPVSSYLAFPPLPQKGAVYFCCTCPEIALG